MSKEIIGIIGAGGVARRTANDFIRKTNGEVAFMAVDQNHVSALDYSLIDGSKPEVIDVLKPYDGAYDVPVVVAIDGPYEKQRLINSWVGNTYTNVIESGVEETAQNALHSLGSGVLIAAGCRFPDSPISIGSHVTINSNVNIPANIEVGDYATVMQGVLLGKGVEIGAGAVIGMGAMIRQNVRIGEGSLVGMGSVVTTDITDNALVCGYRPRKIRTLDRWPSNSDL